MKDATLSQEFAYKELEREFASTFITELMPGILHNFANPLNGIMGRSKLLQRRMDDYFQKINTIHPDLMTQTGDEKNRLVNDVSSICKESDRFYDMFQDLATKFYAIVDRRFEHINLDKLIKDEIRFLDFYLDFKHEIKKTLKPSGDLPYIYGIPSDYSYCFSALFRESMSRMKKSSRKELYVEIEHKKNVISVLIQDTGENIVRPSDDAVFADESSSGTAANKLTLVQRLFREHSVQCYFKRMEDMNSITVEVPVTQEKNTQV